MVPDAIQDGGQEAGLDLALETVAETGGDLADLAAKGVIARNPSGGRSTSYHLVGYNLRAPTMDE